MQLWLPELYRKYIVMM